MSAQPARGVHFHQFVANYFDARRAKMLTYARGAITGINIT